MRKEERGRTKQTKITESFWQKKRLHEFGPATHRAVRVPVTSELLRAAIDCHFVCKAVEALITVGVFLVYQSQ